MPGFVGHYSPPEGAGHLGTDEYTGSFVARYKSVVAHEIGHGSNIDYSATRRATTLTRRVPSFVAATIWTTRL